MPVVSDDYRFVFFCAPLTGSTSVSHTLVESGIGYWAPERDLFDDKGKKLVDRKHGTLAQVRRHFVRMERLHEDFEEVKSKLGLPDHVTLRRLEVTRGERGRMYRMYYDAEARELVHRFYREFIEHFGYSF